MLIKRLLIGTSLLLLESLTIVFLASLKIVKHGLYFAEKLSVLVARGMDNLKNFILPIPAIEPREIDNQHLETRSTTFKNVCSKAFNLLRTVLMLSVRLFNKPMLFVQQYIGNIYSNQQQRPWYVTRVLTRLTQLQSEITMALKYEHAPSVQEQTAQPQQPSNLLDEAIDLALQVEDLSIVINYIQEKSGEFWWNSPATTWPSELKTEIRTSRYLPANYWRDDIVTASQKEIMNQDYDFKCGISGNIKCVPCLLSNPRMGIPYSFDLIQLLMKMQIEEGVADYPGSDISISDSEINFDLEVKQRLDNIRTPIPVRPMESLPVEPIVKSAEQVKPEESEKPVKPTELVQESNVVLTREQLRERRLQAIEQHKQKEMVFSEIHKKDTDASEEKAPRTASKDKAYLRNKNQ